jgi:hypothetical protein
MFAAYGDPLRVRQSEGARGERRVGIDRAAMTGSRSAVRILAGVRLPRCPATGAR